MISVLAVWLKRLFLLLGALVLLSVLVNFIMSNPQLVQFQLAGYQLPQIKASSIAVVAFVGGGLSGLLVAMFSISRLKLANASLQRKLHRRDAEIQKLRTNSLKGLT